MNKSLNRHALDITEKKRSENSIYGAYIFLSLCLLFMLEKKILFVICHK